MTLPARRFLLVGVGVSVAMGILLFRPVELVIYSVGRGGKSWEVFDGIRLAQPLKLPPGFRGVVILSAEQLPHAGRVSVSLRAGVDGPILVEGRAPKVRRGPETFLLRMPVSLPPSSSGTALVVRTSGVARDDPLRLEADPRQEPSPETLHVFGRASARAPLAEARRPAVLAHEARAARPWILTIPETRRRDLVRGLKIAGFSALLPFLFAGLWAQRADWMLRHRRGVLALGVLVVLLAGAGLRVWFAQRIPIINDEQSIVYDAATGNVRQPYVGKFPALLLLQGLYLRFVPLTDPVVPRYLTVAAGLLETLLLAAVARELGSPRMALAVFLIGSLFPIAAAHSAAVLAEQYLALPMLAAAWVVLRARRTKRPRLSSLVIASALVAVGVLIRWSGVFWYGTLLILLRTRTLTEYVRRVLVILSVPVAGLLVLFGGFPEAARTARLADHAVAFFGAFAATLGMRLKRWREIFGSLGSFLALTGLAVRGITRRQRMAAIGLAFLLGVLFLGPQFAREWEQQTPWQANLAAAGTLAVWGAGLFLPGSSRPRGSLLEVLAFLLPPLAAYAIFWRVNPKYLSEFLPGLILLSGLGGERLVSAVVERRALVPAAVATSALTLLSVASWQILTIAPYAGTIRAAALKQAAEIVRARTAPGEPVVAAAVLVPLLADRPLAGNIAHPAAEDPTWRGKPNPRFEAFVGPVADLLERRGAGAVVTEKLFFDSIGRHVRLALALRDGYEPVAEIPSGNSQPLTIYVRRPSPTP